MLHIGSYDSEPESFKVMDDYLSKNHLKRVGRKHREIYLSDPNKAAPEKVKTVLRYFVEEIE